MDTDKRNLEVLLEFARAANAAATVDAVLHEIAGAVRSGLGYDRVAIFLTGKDDRDAMVGAIGTNAEGVDEDLSDLRFSFTEDARWAGIHAGKTDVLYTDNAARQIGLHLPNGKPVRHHVVVPLKTSQRLLGALAVDNGFTDRPIGEQDVQALLALGRQAAAALQSVRLVEELRHSEERLRSLVTSLTETLYSVRIEAGSVTPSFYSPQLETLTGYSPDEALRIPDFWRTVTHPDDRLKLERAKDDLMRGQALTLEYRIVHRKGDVKWVQDTPVPVERHPGSVQVNGSLTDITTRKHLEDRLRRAQRMETIGTLAGGVAHNFNNYLQMVILLIANAQLDMQECDPAYPYMQKAQETLNSASALAKQLIAFGQKAEGARQEVVLDEIIFRTLPLVQPSLGKSIRVEHLPDSDVAPVVVDAAQIQQALINLCINARDAMDGSGTITVRTQNVAVKEQDLRKPQGYPAGEYVRLQVHDTGHGMDLETQERIFEPFFTTKPSGRGTGLGLAVTYRIVADHGGWIDVDSKPDRGTLFSIYLPSAVVARQAQQSPAAQSYDRIVMIVDPSEHQREALASLLDSMGVDVLTAEGVSDAMAVVWDAGERLDAVFCSSSLGAVDIQHLAANIEGEGTPPKLILTGDRGEARAIRRLGVDTGLAVLLRPYSNAKVAETLGLSVGAPSSHAATKRRERSRKSAYEGAHSARARRHN
jgi:PAS domain S-box-containing protein